MDKGLNAYETQGSITKVFINETFFICDTEDWEYLKQYKWFLSKRGYIVTNRNIDGYGGRFHRIIMKASKEFVVDHKKRNKLDNRKSELRITSQKENVRNSGIKNTNKSGYKGVHFNKNAGKWEAYITADYKKIYLGLFESIDKAADARNKAERIYWRKGA